jgi:hypothetical protein
MRSWTRAGGVVCASVRRVARSCDGAVTVVGVVRRYRRGGRDSSPPGPVCGASGVLPFVHRTRCDGGVVESSGRPHVSMKAQDRTDWSHAATNACPSRGGCLVTVRCGRVVDPAFERGASNSVPGGDRAATCTRTEGLFVLASQPQGCSSAPRIELAGRRGHRRQTHPLCGAPFRDDSVASPQCGRQRIADRSRATRGIRRARTTRLSNDRREPVRARCRSRSPLRAWSRSARRRSRREARR